jgi:hypothetical protein
MQSCETPTSRPVFKASRDEYWTAPSIIPTFAVILGLIGDFESPKREAMTTMTFPSALRNLSPALVLAAVLAFAPSSAPQAAAGNPFDLLLGSWRGTGYFRLQDGTQQRILCNTYYTGGGSQLGMAIRCQSDVSKIEIRSKLSKSGSHISGTWEERTYNATGTASGNATDTKINLAISGAVTGQMLVSYSSSRQSVSISTQGIPLQSVSISLSRS